MWSARNSNEAPEGKLPGGLSTIGNATNVAFSMHSYKLRFYFIFQLETDVNIISRKAREALQKYNHQVRSFFMMKFNF